MNLIQDIQNLSAWTEKSNCKNMDTDLFFPELGNNYDPFVKDVCMSCEVIDECAWYANETSAIYGMFGGMSPNQREVWRKKNKAILGESRSQWEARR